MGRRSRPTERVTPLGVAKALRPPGTPQAGARDHAPSNAAGEAAVAASRVALFRKSATREDHPGPTPGRPVTPQTLSRHASPWNEETPGRSRPRGSINSPCSHGALDVKRAIPWSAGRAREKMERTAPPRSSARPCTTCGPPGRATLPPQHERTTATDDDNNRATKPTERTTGPPRRAGGRDGRGGRSRPGD
jgi:hypothetical protein